MEKIARQIDLPPENPGRRGFKKAYLPQRVGEDAEKPEKRSKHFANGKEEAIVNSYTYSTARTEKKYADLTAIFEK